MSGPNPPERELGGQPSDDRAGDREELTDTGFSRAYSAPESEQYTIAPYMPAEIELYDYDAYEQSGAAGDELPPPRWPWVVGITAIVAAIALVASVSLLVTNRDTTNTATPTTTTVTTPPVQDQITTTTPPPPPPPPPPPRSELLGVTVALCAAAAAAVSCCAATDAACLAAAAAAARGLLCATL